MSVHGSPLFAAYVQNLRRIYWAEFIESQVQATNEAQFRASLVSPPIPDTDELLRAYNYHRHRGLSPREAVEAGPKKG